MRSLLPLLLALAACSAAPTEDAPTLPAPAETSVFDRCVDFATRLCTDSEGCCQRAYGGFDPESCLAAFEHDVCRPGADAVTAGKATFDEGAVDDCLAAHAEAHAVCIPTWEQTLALRKRIYTACRVIEGTSEVGRGCTVAATCKRPAGIASVDCVKNVCQEIEILSEGAACPFPSGSVSVCDAGLACDAQGLGESGHCVRAPGPGEACDPRVLESPACGLGSYCDPDAGECKVATNLGGPGCAQGTECVSFSCDRLARECAPAPAVLSRGTCLGAPQKP